MICPKICIPGRDLDLPNSFFRTVRHLPIDNHRQTVNPSERNYSGDARLRGFGVIERYDVSAQLDLPVVSASGVNLFPNAGFGVKFMFHFVLFFTCFVCFEPRSRRALIFWSVSLARLIRWLRIPLMIIINSSRFNSTVQTV